MRKIIVLSMISLDGVIQGPGGPKEDTSGGFKYGGWVAPLGDEIYNNVVGEELKPAEYILGRKTFEIWEDYWPKHAAIWPAINSGNKYVLSKTRTKTDWENTVFFKSVASIKKLKEAPFKKKAGQSSDLHIWGSSEIVQLLLKHDLVDELRLKIHPVVLGKGKRLFDNGAAPATFKLTESIVTTKGVIIATYKKTGKVKTGKAGPDL